MINNDVERTYRIDITSQFMNDVNKNTGWVDRASAWLKDRAVDYDCYIRGSDEEYCHIIYFTYEDDAVMFKILFGGV